jgi:hypothetical protein
MTEEQRLTILDNAKTFFRDKIVRSHINGGSARASRLSDYNVNPFLYKYLANFLRGNDDPRSIAEALVYPRLLGSSINTSFGMRIQTLMGVLFDGILGSMVAGIDIEFDDAIDGRKKYCQLKAGPNTINHHDVETVFGHFQSAANIARQNRLDIGLNDFVVGVIYGEPEELSSHYQRIKSRYPVYIGQEFWHRLTGKEDFYIDIITAFGEVAKEFNGTEKLEETVTKLAKDIEDQLRTD